MAAGVCNVTAAACLRTCPHLAIAFDGNGNGRAVVDSSFHHFFDYNLDPRAGCPSFVTEPSGSGMLENPQAVADVKAYVENIAKWLAE